MDLRCQMPYVSFFTRAETLTKCVSISVISKKTLMVKTSKIWFQGYFARAKAMSRGVYIGAKGMSHQGFFCTSWLTRFPLIFWDFSKLAGKRHFYGNLQKQCERAIWQSGNMNSWNPKTFPLPTFTYSNNLYTIKYKN